MRFSADGDPRYLKPVRVLFELESGDEPAVDLIALACSTLAGSTYDEIHIDLPLADTTLSAIRDFTGAP